MLQALFIISLLQLAPPRLVLAPGAVFLDARGTDVLIGTPDTPPPDSDPELKMMVRLETGGRKRPWAFADRAVSHASFRGDHAIVVVTPDGALVDVPRAAGRAETTLDRDVMGPVGSSADGRFVVYAKGQAPDTDIVWLDRASGVKAPVSSGFAPAWSPGVAADGQLVVFVSGKTGRPCLYVAVRRGDAALAAPSRIPLKSEVFPASLSPTRVLGDRVAFEGERGSYLVTLDGQHADFKAGAKAPAWLEPGRLLGVLEGQALVAWRPSP